MLLLAISWQRFCRNRQWFLLNNFIRLHNIVIQPRQSLLPALRRKLTPPHSKHTPAQKFQLHFRPVIASLIQSNFVFPEFMISTWYSELVTTDMTMPETPVDKHHNLVFPEHNVRTSRKLLVMNSEPKTAGMQILAHHKFRLGILAPYGTHTFVALLRCHSVGHTLYNNPKSKSAARNHIPAALCFRKATYIAYLLAMLLLTVRRRRPLARRRASTLRPSGVDILSRNPCLFTLFLFEG